MRVQTNCIEFQTVEPRDLLNFYFSEKNLGVVSPTHFVYGFLRKMFLMLYPYKWPNFIVWLSLLLEILGNMCIVIICFACDDIINFEINLKFLIKPFSYMTKKVRNLKTRKIFLGEIKSIFKGFQLPEIITNSGTNPDVGLKFSGSSYIHF